MDVRTWIEKNKINYPSATIRLVNKSKNLIIGSYWLPWSDCKIKDIKITSKWIFIYI